MSIVPRFDGASALCPSQVKVEDNCDESSLRPLEEGPATQISPAILLCLCPKYANYSIVFANVKATTTVDSCHGTLRRMPLQQTSCLRSTNIVRNVVGRFLASQKPQYLTNVWGQGSKDTSMFGLRMEHLVRATQTQRGNARAMINHWGVLRQGFSSKV